MTEWSWLPIRRAASLAPCRSLIAPFSPPEFNLEAVQDGFQVDSWVTLHHIHLVWGRSFKWTKSRGEEFWMCLVDIGTPGSDMKWNIGRLLVWCCWWLGLVLRTLPPDGNVLFFFQGPSTYRRRCFSQRVFCVLLSRWRTVGLHRWQNNQDLHDGPHISPSLSITACIHPDNHLRIHNWEAYGDKAPLSSDLGIYLPLPMHSTTWSVCWELHLGRDGGGGGGAFSQLPGSQYVWVHFFPLHGKWMWGPEGPDISGAWPGSSCLYLAVYCDAPVMRTGIGPLRRPVGNLYSHLHLPLCYRMDNSLN